MKIKGFSNKCLKWKISYLMQDSECRSKNYMFWVKVQRSCCKDIRETSQRNVSEEKLWNEKCSLLGGYQFQADVDLGPGSNFRQGQRYEIRALSKVWKLQVLRRSARYEKGSISCQNCSEGRKNMFWVKVQTLCSDHGREVHRRNVFVGSQLTRFSYLQ